MFVYLISLHYIPLKIVHLLPGNGVMLSTDTEEAPSVMSLPHEDGEETICFGDRQGDGEVDETLTCVCGVDDGDREEDFVCREVLLTAVAAGGELYLFCLASIGFCCSIPFSLSAL